MDIVLVGINPSAYSVRVGHYFANPRNRFWRAFNHSGLIEVELSPEQDGTFLDHGIGFTDVVKRPSAQASGLTAADYRRWAPLLKKKLEHYQPLISCFHGITAYRQYLKYAEGMNERPELGLQVRTIRRSQIYVVPNPSPANARFSAEDLTGWYIKLKALRDELKAR